MDLGINLYLIAAAVLVFVVILAAVKTVPQGMHYTVERFGRYTRTLRPGLSILTPFVERIGDKINMREQVLDVPSQEVITRDNATVSANGVTFFQVLDAAKAAYEVTDLEQGILNLTMTNIRSVMGSMDLDELLSNRDEINSRVLRVVDAAVDPWGVKITRIEIKDINPPPDLTQAMARQMKAEREKRALVLEADGARLAAIARAEGEKQSLILAAEGRLEAAMRDAEARERSAQAEANATASVSAAIEAGSVQAINYFVADKYVGALRDLAAAPNQRTLILPIDAVATLGSLAGIAEIAREAFGPHPAGGAPATSPEPPRPDRPRRDAEDDYHPWETRGEASAASVPPAPAPEPEPRREAPASSAQASRSDRFQRISAATEALAERLSVHDPWGRRP
ncbi:SPFH domain-containing protein [Acuticoccus sp. I52.16.1]|uniref:SPFH domain-containing protein n=1 Tax=Acuticoccus sp. I52.16.1 TaxID=2928472 RepID=UPI001FD50F91|nr:SPFH domain-containing protein [Acuticoccus sp. I52.16.1]UOM36793.1 SPFH/Band 7/PHB domain protein [Acuticoccus sp. I52.16.1]